MGAMEEGIFLEGIEAEMIVVQVEASRMVGGIGSWRAFWPCSLLPSVSPFSFLDPLDQTPLGEAEPKANVLVSFAFFIQYVVHFSFLAPGPECD